MIVKNPKTGKIIELRDLPENYAWYPKRSWWTRVGTMFDKFCNTLFAGPFNYLMWKLYGKDYKAFGWAEEYISSVLGKQQSQGCILCTKICKILNFFQKDHCNKAIQPYIGLTPPKSYWD